MSTSVESLILDGYREDNLIGVGDPPTTAEQTEALRRLNTFIRTLLGHEAGMHLTEWPVPSVQRSTPVAARYPFPPFADDLTSDVYLHPPANVRIMSLVEEVTTVYFPEKPCDGARMGFADVGNTAILTLDGNGRLIEGATTLTLDPDADTPVEQAEWLYRSDTGNWVRVDEDLTLSDSCPLPPAFDDLLICALSIRLAPRHGKSASAETVAMYKAQLTKLAARYQQIAPSLGNASDFTGDTGAGFNPLA